MSLIEAIFVISWIVLAVIGGIKMIKKLAGSMARAYINRTAKQQISERIRRRQELKELLEELKYEDEHNKQYELKQIEQDKTQQADKQKQEQERRQQQEQEEISKFEKLLTVCLPKVLPQVSTDSTPQVKVE